jgi:hypothetical protein
MPITAKLSQAFYDRLGDHVTNELVEWLNHVDAHHSSELRELNDLNYARFRAELGEQFAEQDVKWEQRFAEMDAKWERRLAEMDVKWERRLAELEVKWERRLAELEVKWEHRFAALETLIAQRFTEQTRFLYLALVTQILLIAGLYLR